VSTPDLLLAVMLIGLPLWGLAWAARRQMRLFILEVREGRIVLLKGRMPQRLLDDINDVVARERPLVLKVTCVIESGEAGLHFSEATDAGLQQVIRNLVGEYPALRLKQAPKVRTKYTS